MNPNKSSLDPNYPVKRKTRLEDLEDRIAEAETYLETLEDDLKNIGFKEVDKLNSILNEVKEMKKNVQGKSLEDEKTLDSEVKQISTNP